GRRDFVAILQERAPEFVISMLAIFKAGAAYVPVDPTYPRERIHYLLTDCQARALVPRPATPDHFADILPDCEDLQTIVCLDKAHRSAIVAGRNANSLIGPAEITAMPCGNLGLPADASDPMYMIYTSGSTGLPKGAIVRHDGAVNHIFAQ